MCRVLGVGFRLQGSGFRVTGGLLGLAVGSRGLAGEAFRVHPKPEIHPKP